MHTRRSANLDQVGDRVIRNHGSGRRRRQRAVPLDLGLADPDAVHDNVEGAVLLAEDREAELQGLGGALRVELEGQGWGRIARA
jgi:hypothetical protein